MVTPKHSDFRGDRCGAQARRRVSVFKGSFLCLEKIAGHHQLLISDNISAVLLYCMTSVCCTTCSSTLKMWSLSRNRSSVGTNARQPAPKNGLEMPPAPPGRAAPHLCAWAHAQRGRDGQHLPLPRDAAGARGAGISMGGAVYCRAWLVGAWLETRLARPRVAPPPCWPCPHRGRVPSGSRPLPARPLVGPHVFLHTTP